MNKVNKIILGEIKKNIDLNIFVDFLNEKYSRNGLMFSNDSNTIIIYNYTKIDKKDLQRFEGILEGINYDPNESKTG
jgi:hypothetical protein